MKYQSCYNNIEVGDIVYLYQNLSGNMGTRRYHDKIAPYPVISTRFGCVTVRSQSSVAIPINIFLSEIVRIVKKQ